MPLSEQEQRLLEEMERSLYHNDADFVAAVGKRQGRTSYRMVVLGVLIAIVGIAVIVTGVATSIPILGIAGFIVMFVGVLLAFSFPRRRGMTGPDDLPHERPSASAKPGLMDRLNERWDKRQDEHGQ